MGDEDSGAAFRRRPDSLLNVILGGAVDGAGGVVEDEYLRVGQEGTGNRQPLALPSAEGHTALPDDRLVPSGNLHDELVGLRFLCGLFDFLLRCIGPAEADVIGDAAAEQEDLLLDDADLRTQGCQISISDIDAVYQ